MKIVYRAENIIDANLVKAALEQAGIPAFVAGEYLVGAAGQLPVRDLVSVMVPESDLERAEPVVEGVASALEELRERGDPDPSAVPAF